MKYSLSIFFIIIFQFLIIDNSLSQIINMEGIIGMEGGPLYTYDVKAKRTGNPNEFKGIATTHLVEGKNFRVEVLFTIDPLANSVDFRETKILDEDAFSSNVTVCLVKAKLFYNSEKGVLSGPINTEMSANGKYCAIGNITFTNRSALNTIFNVKEKLEVVEKEKKILIESKEEHLDNKKVVVKTNTNHTKPISSPQPKNNESKTKQVTEGKGIVLNWNNENVIFEIWDDGNIDHDMVSVFYNNQEILSNYKLIKEPKKIELSTGGSELNIITIKAMNNGGDPPNTAMIRFYDGDVTHDVISHNDAGKSSIIRIQKKI